MDFKSSEKNKQTLYELDSQFMLGCNIMVIAMSHDKVENTIRSFFPEEIFYDFYDGKLINADGEGLYPIYDTFQKPLLFLRGGFVTPVQEAGKDCNYVECMKNAPIDLIFAIDKHSKAAGNIVFDDGISIFYF